MPQCALIWPEPVSFKPAVSASMKIFLHHRTVRFGECDPAGVVYYPVFFNWFHEAMEAWFEEELGEPYGSVIQRTGFPAKSTSAQFFKPCRIGEELRINLSLTDLRTKGMHIHLSIEGLDGTVKADGSVVCVAIGTAKGAFQFKPVPIPQNLHQNMQAFLKDA